MFSERGDDSVDREDQEEDPLADGRGGRVARQGGPVREAGQGAQGARGGSRGRGRSRAQQTHSVRERRRQGRGQERRTHREGGRVREADRRAGTVSTSCTSIYVQCCEERMRLSCSKRLILQSHISKTIQHGSKNKSFLNFCHEYNNFCLEIQPSLFPKLETCDFGRKVFKIANF